MVERSMNVLGMKMVPGVQLKWIKTEIMLEGKASGAYAVKNVQFHLNQVSNISKI